ncbi:MAG: hypothetical protein EBT36_01415 [Betaproteobacteria bacterium]|jgi:hypothetical protein|nr:hypothetical protein [Betaproteobacteria bacterium]HAB46767.1 hypothetical protein [Lautropia sp.]NBP35217.1 hypothetical protein [Betaproteobacteria bacterium]NBP38394.1 hypothetical protein [Betaproteobacteria bacterium]NBQ79143.1 hypothetical protein [Betaproteobacteria bacterium]
MPSHGSPTHQTGQSWPLERVEQPIKQGFDANRATQKAPFSSDPHLATPIAMTLFLNRSLFLNQSY